MSKLESQEEIKNLKQMHGHASGEILELLKLNLQKRQDRIKDYFEECLGRYDIIFGYL